VNQKIDQEKIQREFQTLRESLKTVQLATTDTAGIPEASYAPYVWIGSACYLYLSALARHTTNLLTNPAIGLLFIEAEAKTRNLFARRRIILRGEVEIVARESPQFAIVMTEFKIRFGDFINVVEPLQDFQLFKIDPTSGRFIRGFAQAFELTGPGLNVITHIDLENR
jgi:putative heme iron utilization protein